MTSLTLQYERLCPDCLQKLQVGGFLVFLPTTVVEVLVDVEEVVTTEADISGFWSFFACGLCFWVFTLIGALLRNECIYHILNYWTQTINLDFFQFLDHSVDETLYTVLK